MERLAILAATALFLAIAGCSSLPDPHVFFPKMEALEPFVGCEDRRQRRKEVSACVVEWRKEKDAKTISFEDFVPGVEGLFASLGQHQDMRRYVNFCLAAKGLRILPPKLTQPDKEDEAAVAGRAMRSCPCCPINAENADDSGDGS